MDKKAKELLKEMEKQLKWNEGDPLTIAAIADLLNDNGEEERAEVWNRAAKVAAEIREAKRLLHDLNKLYEMKRNELEVRIGVARKACTHPLVEYHPDASGNNDSTDECLCCGKRARHFNRQEEGPR